MTRAKERADLEAARPFLDGKNAALAKELERHGYFDAMTLNKARTGFWSLFSPEPEQRRQALVETLREGGHENFADRFEAGEFDAPRVEKAPTG